ncbi:hypothetical protein Hanom_Chr05g00408881 [Helianthus anomalus]
MKKSKGRRRRTLIAVIIIFVGSWKGLTSDQGTRMSSACLFDFLPSILDSSI